VNKEEFIKDFKEVKLSGISHKIFKNVFQPTPSLETMLQFVEDSKAKGTYRSDREGFYIIHSHDPADFEGYGAYDDFLSAARTVYTDLDEMQNFGTTMVASEKYRAIVEVSGIMRHTDQTDTIHWTTSGATIWRIFDKDGEHEYVVEAGDIFYVKHEIEHEVESLTPRAGIVLSAGKYSQEFLDKQENK
jgi:mannose-6-phosphate isomerase-like protein (cupin superfamily)